MARIPGLRLAKGLQLWEVRRNPDPPYLTPGVWLDTGPRLRLKGRFRERRTLEVRLDQLTREPVG